MSLYASYLQAAKRKHADAATIAATAADELTAKQLAQLVSVLADRHGYKLPKARRDPLIDDLLAEGVQPVRIAELLGCHWRTVARRADRQVGVTDRLNKRCRRDKTGSRAALPILSTAYGDLHLIQGVLANDPVAIATWEEGRS